MLVNSCKLKDFPFIVVVVVDFFFTCLPFLVSLSLAHSMTWQKFFIHFLFESLFSSHRSVSALKHRSTRKTVRDGNIIIVATKTLRLQPNYSKMNVILTSFQHNFVSWLHPTEMQKNIRSYTIINFFFCSTFCMQIKISTFFPPFPLFRIK